MKIRCLIGRLARVLGLLVLMSSSTLSGGCRDVYEPSYEQKKSPIADMVTAYRAAQLSDEQAADILLQRFTFGPRPGDRRQLLQQGLTEWFEVQLKASSMEPELQSRLAVFDALSLSDAELIRRFPSSSMLSAHARRFYEDVLPGRDEPVMDFSIIQAKLDMFSREHGFHSLEAHLLPQLYGQKLMRAVYAENQLQEVMTDFWLNHFFTGTTHFGSRPWILSHERDVLRPHALGNFSDLLRLSMQHPAILNYFSREAQPQTIKDTETTQGMRLADQPQLADQLRQKISAVITQIEQEQDLILKREFWPATGPNRVLAQNLLQHYTLGSMAVLSQHDIDEVARLLTGWHTRPYGPSEEWFAVDFSNTHALGFVNRGSFWFRADQHDALPKIALGQVFPAGGGLEEGERLLAWLASHPDTARHIVTKLVRHFVGESVNVSLTDRLVRRFIESKGNVCAVLVAMVSEPAFWLAAVQQPKFKTPFQFMASALRSAQADISTATELIDWAAQLGQPPYQYQEATGYPLDGQRWLDNGAVIARVRFAQALQAGAINGVKVTTLQLPSLALQLAAPAFQLH